MQNAFLVTASIGCGKSAFIKIANSLGFKSISADEISHQILDENAKELAFIFNDTKLLYKQKIDRKYLGNLVFSDNIAKKRLEEFILPKIRKELLEQMTILNKKNQFFFVEIPLLFESRAYENLGKTILIYSTKEQSLARIIQRDNLSKEEAKKRLNAQMDIEEKLLLADFVLYNTSSYEDFKQKCILFLEKLSKGKL
ncbi:dephospho-CoA kinase [Campylobacter sp. MIT 21-1685]|uniref:dephospho-CoA kinase n=1 Tax=unclassified Campylobacter TaxID=2593542 RepID=UPI00224B07D0|nr:MULTISPECIES: dephospho-CoA kinase [unclassified Campylobacter]MCX2683771.1 dephospho-CoA kinase [Campylobacter sp. MIT 21-1684]MCX2752054.1 dephospho-CoA kinase [Campylobacter sp. MIT 21-1682]MCX2808248.1 dephospho-CoA kinase [Campylobacter sp. MIT 21-1685]